MARFESKGLQFLYALFLTFSAFYVTYLSDKGTYYIDVVCNGGSSSRFGVLYV
jgi:hypothetical protein